MALIECPDCSREISDAAPTCPGCGRPMAAQTIEKTSKEWKIVQLAGMGLFTVGIAIFCIDARRTGGESASRTGIIIAIAGLAAYGAARIGAWWKHG